MWFLNKKNLESDEYKKLNVEISRIEGKLLHQEQMFKVMAKEFEAEIQIMQTNMNSLRGLVNRKVSGEKEEDQKTKDGKVYLGEDRLK